MEIPPVAIDVLESTSSTMDAARERVLGGRFQFDPAPVACECIMAREQAAGRGQRGREWYAARGESLCATYILHCPRVTQPGAAAQLGLLAGVAVASALLLYDIPPKIGLKWPNDVMLNGKKAGGILVEMMKSPGGPWVALVGVGLNVSVRKFPPDLSRTATSLALEGVDAAGLPGLEGLAGDIGVSLSRWAIQCAGEFHPLLRVWRRLDATSGRRYRTDWNGVPVIGTAEGIDDKGALLLRRDDGARIAVTSASSLRELE